MLSESSPPPEVNFDVRLLACQVHRPNESEVMAVSKELSKRVQATIAGPATSPLQRRTPRSHALRCRKFGVNSKMTSDRWMSNFLGELISASSFW
eukprot:2531207-Amphidinium_carterae.1